MTAPEFNEMAALIVRLRTDLELHTDSLRQSNAQCGEYLRQNEQLHSELVEVRAALAAATTQRDSYKQTLDKWEREDTKPHACVTADDVADHVAPPVLNRGEPDPANDPKDAGLEFRNVVPTPEMSFEELYKQEGSERDLAELNPIAELLGKPTQLTKEEDAYNKGYNAALGDLFIVLDAYDIEITTDDRYLTYMKIFNKIELAKEALQKPTNSKEV